ncbi:MAG: gliding motility-associated ABC transporter ATP-binding subunit GldA, partial [Flavobacteriales bacterium]|nr:gliding motility-associated ABC transporter ATP-binding subunit GldA [Flavobacteriales bacterium]
RVLLEVEFDLAVHANVLKNLAGVLNVHRKEDSTWLLEHDATTDIRPAVFRFAVDNGLQVLGMRRTERALEDIFKELTRPGK